MHKLMPVSLALALAAPLGAMATTAATTTAEPAADLNTLRQEIAAIRAAYEARMEALEQRLKAAEAAAVQAPAAAPAPPPQPAATGGANAFNPAMSLILSGIYGRTSKDPEKYSISGFQLPTGAEAGPGSRGFSLAESELGFAASIDPWLRGVANISLHGDDSVSVEEAYIQTTSLGGGLTAKAGRFFSGVGYLNSQHAHTWDFVDNPLAYQALLGTQYGDDGVQLNWLAPTDQFIELGVELGRGRSFPGSDLNRNGAGMRAITAHTGGDIGDSHSWRAGLSMLSARADGQELLGQAASGDSISSAFSGRTRVWVADAIWKWAPDGNATRTSFKLQGEYLRSTRSGSLLADLGGAASADGYKAVQSGWYVQGVYQFMPRWRVGLRTEQLDAGTPDYGLNAGLFAATGFKPRKDTVMLDFNSSEFSRVRLQLANDRSREGSSDKQLFLQYQMSLGAHGAHSY